MDRRIALVFALAAAGGISQAAESQLQGAQRCAQIQDSLQRLVCYDRVFAQPGAAPTAPAAPAAPAVPAAPVAVAPAAPPAATAVVERDQFGAEGLKRSEAERKAETPPRTLTATVTELRETRPNLYRILLDNDQVWQQIDMDSGFNLTKGDSVEITRGALGGYFITRTSRGASSWVRVNRIK